MDAVAEVKVLTTNYQAEYGRMSSGVISVITKSGTRDSTAAAGASFRHEELNANNFFNNRHRHAENPYRYRIFGYSIGRAGLYPEAVQHREEQAVLLLVAGILPH